MTHLGGLIGLVIGLVIYGIYRVCFAEEAAPAVLPEAPVQVAGSTCSQCGTYLCAYSDGQVFSAKKTVYCNDCFAKLPVPESRQVEPKKRPPELPHFTFDRDA